MTRRARSLSKEVKRFPDLDSSQTVDWDLGTRPGIMKLARFLFWTIYFLTLTNSVCGQKRFRGTLPAYAFITLFYLVLLN